MFADPRLYWIHVFNTKCDMWFFLVTHINTNLTLVILKLSFTLLTVYVPLGLTPLFFSSLTIFFIPYINP